MGTREVMAGDNGGFMVEDDLGQFSERVLLLLENEIIYAEKCRDALHHAENWTMRTQAVKMVNLYEELVIAAEHAAEQDELREPVTSELF